MLGVLTWPFSSVSLCYIFSVPRRFLKEINVPVNTMLGGKLLQLFISLLVKTPSPPLPSPTRTGEETSTSGQNERIKLFKRCERLWRSLGSWKMKSSSMKLYMQKAKGMQNLTWKGFSTVEFASKPVKRYNAKKYRRVSFAFLVKEAVWWISLPSFYVDANSRRFQQHYSGEAMLKKKKRKKKKKQITHCLTSFQN